MKRVKFYLSMILVVCMLSSMCTAFAESTLSWVANPVEGVSGSIYGVTPFGFIIQNWRNERIVYSAVVSDKGIVSGKVNQEVYEVTEDGYMPYYDYERSIGGVFELDGSHIFEEGKYSNVHVINHDRFICSVDFDGEYQSAILDKQGNEIVPFGKYNSLSYDYGFVIAYTNDYKQELIDIDGNVIVPAGQADSITTIPSNDRYLVRDYEANKTTLRKVDGTDILTVDGYLNYAPINSLECSVYDPDTRSYTYSIYNFDGKLVDTFVSKGRPYAERDINNLPEYDLSYDDSYNQIVVDKDGNVVYQSEEVNIEAVYGNIIKIANKDWENRTVGLVDVNGNTIVDLGEYQNIEYCADLDLFAFEKNNSISLAKIESENTEPKKEETKISVIVNGKEVVFDQLPVIIDGRTLVPLRAIFEALGADVSWDETTKTVTSTLGDITVKLTIDTNTMLVNEETKTLDVNAQIISSRTMVPVRAIGEAFGALVGWDDATKTVTVENN